MCTHKTRKSAAGRRHFVAAGPYYGQLERYCCAQFPFFIISYKKTKKKRDLSPSFGHQSRMEEKKSLFPFNIDSLLVPLVLVLAINRIPLCWFSSYIRLEIPSDAFPSFPSIPYTYSSLKVLSLVGGGRKKKRLPLRAKMGFFFFCKTFD